LPNPEDVSQKPPKKRASTPSGKIVMLIPRFPPEIYGGAEQQCLRLSAALTRRGHDVVVLTTRGEHQTAADEVINGVCVVRFATRHEPDHGGSHMPSSLKWTVAVLRWLARRRREVALVHVHQGKFHVLPALLANCFWDLPFVVKVGAAEEDFDYARLAAKSGGYGRIVLARLLKTCSAHIAISSRIAEHMHAIGAPTARIHRIPNGIDTEVFVPGPPPPMAQRRSFLFMGRLEDEKQPMLLLRAFAQALAGEESRREQLRLVIAGDGSRLEDMRAYCGETGIGGQVALLGRVDDVRPLMAEAHFFVLPSWIEGLSNALLESMSCGLVPIASAISGNTDVIRHEENGFLFERDDEAALVACLATAATMPEATWTTMRQAARRTIETDYDMERVADRYEALYQCVARALG
jgi:glycosyltransferase involved in cell wall biosynthesis